MKWLLCIALWCVWLQSCTSTKLVTAPPKLAASAAKADVQLLQRILYQQHPSTFWYTPQSTIDSAFQQVLQSIPDSISELQLKNALAQVIAQMKCGHTSVQFSKAYTKWNDQYKGPQMPLMVRIINADSMVLIRSLTVNDTTLTRGSYITHINGKTARWYIDTLQQFISTDGNALSFKYLYLSNSFAGMYRLILGLDTAYHINFIDTNGVAKQTVLKNFIVKKDTTKKAIATVITTPILSKRAIRKREKAQTLQLQIDTAQHTAYLRIGSFSRYTMRRFLRQSFATLTEYRIQQLAIDVRNNTGGRVARNVLLTRYLIKQPFKDGDTVMAIRRNFGANGKYIQPRWLFWLGLQLRTKRNAADGNYYMRGYAKEVHRPFQKHHFNGRIYILQNGYTFSAATMFTNALKGQSNVTIVGDESGGGSYGNSAINTATITLPNSGIRVRLPLYRIVFPNKTLADKTARGVLPDVWVKPTALAVKEGKDNALLQVQALMRQHLP
ncbi:MAG TPA: hypothetical protein DCL43_03135 [Chitinophagaceae bacterium]|nr:hypothetical protein [Chitinophagaceae bacterium]